MTNSPQVDDRACKATPAAELERKIMNPSIPKNEAEWWASREIERLREELQAERDKGGWKPIGTAPKDGTVILGFGEAAGEINGPFGEPEMLTISWLNGWTDYAGYEWSAQGTDAHCIWMKPTHWHPLPPPPKTGE